MIPLFFEDVYMGHSIDNENHCQWNIRSNFDDKMNLGGGNLLQQPVMC
jgi:hypothetical protein